MLAGWLLLARELFWCVLLIEKKKTMGVASAIGHSKKAKNKLKFSGVVEMLLTLVCVMYSW